MVFNHKTKTGEHTMKIKLIKTTISYNGDETETVVEFNVGNKFLTNGRTKISIKNMIIYGHSHSGYYSDSCYYSFNDKNDREKLESYMEKIKKQNEKQKKIDNMFKNTKTFQEIIDETKKFGYYIVTHMKSLSFHKKIGNGYESIPSFSFRIEPIENGYSYNEITYDYDEFTEKFNNAMNESKNVVRELDETIKNDLYEKYNVVVFRKKNYFLIGKSYRGSRTSMYCNWCHKYIGKLNYKEFTIEKLYEIAKKIELKENV